jgi:hypothetical protein
MKIKNRSLIVRHTKDDLKQEYILRNQVPGIQDRELKLSDVFDSMPHGLVLKEETGLGATTLELTSKRNSIIVEPIKVTASSKAYKAFETLYVGSPTIQHPSTIKNADITNYLDDTTIKHKKIVVVADSLPRLINVIGSNVYQDFFFMIDEIDSFQLDSFYRASMESCIDVYKNFPPENRTMVSATTLKFSDPDLSKEPLTAIRYEYTNTRKIDLSFTPTNIQAPAISKILELLESGSNDKIMVAYNSVSGCFDIAKHLTSNGLIDIEETKILCSNRSKDKVGNLYAELDSDKLPGRINFVTSAYFTGFDLSERYHLVSISSAINSIHSLSDKRLKQIAGRCRDKEGLLSETIIYNIVPKNSKSEILTEAQLIQAAEKEIGALKCIEENYRDHPMMKSTTQTIMQLISQSTTSSIFQLVRIKNKIPTTSYLNIDAYIETQRVRNELYQSQPDLLNTLRAAGHKVTIRHLNSNLNIEKTDIEKINIADQINPLITQLQALHRAVTPKQLLVTHEKELTSLQIAIINWYYNVYKYIERDRLFELIKEAGTSKDRRRLNNIFLSAVYLTLDPRSLYKRVVSFHIPVGSTFTREELIEKWNLIYTEMGWSTQRIETTTQAIRMTKLHYKTTKRRNPIGHYISSENPLDLSLINYRPIENGQKINLMKLLGI